MNFDSKFWGNPDSWLSAILLDSEGSQAYGKIKNNLGLLERVPDPKTGFHYLDVVEVTSTNRTQMYRDDIIKEFQAIAIHKLSGNFTFSYEVIIPSSKDYFELLDWFTSKNQKTEVTFKTKFNDEEWLKGICSSKNIREAEKILNSFNRQKWRYRFFKKEASGLKYKNLKFCG